MIIGCDYNHPKHEGSDFTNTFFTPLLEKFTNENKDIMILVEFNFNLIDYNDDKNTGINTGKNTFLTECSLNLFYLRLQHALELKETLKRLSVTSIITSF